MTGLNQIAACPEEFTRLAGMLQSCQPARVLGLLPDPVPPGFVPIQAQALLDLDCYIQARQLLESWLPRLEGKELAQAELLWVQPALRLGWVDQAILTAEHVASSDVDDELRSSALAWSGLGYAQKHCWSLAEQALHMALELAPMHPPVLAAYGRLRLEADQRIEARQIYHRLGAHPGVWARVHAGWGISFIAYLLGEFEAAWTVARAALALSSEAIAPLYVMAQVALVLNEEDRLISVLDMLAQRSPKAEGLSYLHSELTHLQKRNYIPASQSAKRLSAFPTLVQRRDYCGPSTVELVLRYWQNDLPISAEQIAEQVKYPHTGSPIYRMRDFFHLAGFDTIRTLAPLPKLKQLVDAGIPAIIQQEYPNSSHVAVVIGYDDQEHSIELQDPMTHIVVRVPEADLNRLRHLYLDSAIVAYPRRRDLEKVLSQLDLFNNSAVVWTDQAVMELDQGHLEKAADLLERAVRRLPAHSLSWMMLLYACLELWRQSRQQVFDFPQEDKFSSEPLPPGADAARQRFNTHLAHAAAIYPGAEFIAMFEGSAALFENDLDRALLAFKKASQIDPQDARILASLAECFFALHQPRACLEAAQDALSIDAALPAANIWMSRALTATGQDHALHYARAALELAPDWWLSHLAMAEIQFNQRQYELAASSLERCLAFSPFNPEGLVLKTQLAFAENNLEAAVKDLQNLQRSPYLLSLTVQYQYFQLSCRILYEQNRFDQALERSRELLERFPQDAWGMQFLAGVTCEHMLAAVEPQKFDVQSGVVDLYENAIQANRGDLAVIGDYLHYMELLSGMEAALAAIQRLQRTYPKSGRLFFLKGKLHHQSRQVAQAGEAMLQALQFSDAITNRDELNLAVLCIFQVLGAEATERSLHEIIDRAQGIPLVECLRSLGLILTDYSSERLAARRLLKEALSLHPDDAQVIYRLGEIALSPEKQEQAYRQALILEPGWGEARTALANFLIVQNRAAEALDLTKNHEASIPGLRNLHAQALFAMGQYEQAARSWQEINTQEDSQVEESWVGQWLAEMNSGWYGRALNTARKAARLYKPSAQWALRLAMTFAKLQRFSDARKTLKQAKSMGVENQDELRLEIELALGQQDYPAAQEWIEALLTYQFQEGVPVRWGWTQMQQFRVWVELGRLDEAKKIIQCHHLTPLELSEAASAALEIGASGLALELAQEATSQQPDLIPGRLAQANAQVELGQEAEASDIFQHIRQAAPNEHKPYEFLALKLAQDGRLDEALGLADQALALGAHCAQAWAVRGLIHFLSSQPGEALFDLETAWNRMGTRQRERLPVFWLVLAHLQRKLDLAQEWYSKAYHSGTYNILRRLLPRIEPLLNAD